VKFAWPQSQKLVVKGQTGKLYLEHTVVAKENWYSIGRLYNISPKEIAPFNNLTLEHSLGIGEKLEIPLTSTNFSQDGQKAAGETLVPVYYLVQEKEWAYRVSVNHNNVPIPSLEKWNHISKNDVGAGMRLIVGYLKVKTALSALAAGGGAGAVASVGPVPGSGQVTGSGTVASSGQVGGSGAGQVMGSGTVSGSGSVAGAGPGSVAGVGAGSGEGSNPVSGGGSSPAAASAPPVTAKSTTGNGEKPANAPVPAPSAPVPAANAPVTAKSTAGNDEKPATTANAPAAMPAATTASVGAPSTTSPHPSHPAAPINFNGGYFKTDFTGGSNNISGEAAIFKSTSGWQDGKYYALMNNVPVGTIIRITLPSTGKTVFAKVLGGLPDMKESTGLTVRISNAAASELGAGEGRFAVQIGR